MTREEITWATFDCYGTLVDWDAGFGGLLYHIALTSEEAPLPGPVLRAEWEAIQFELIQGAYRPYTEILAESLRIWCARHQYPYLDGYDDAIVQSMKSIQPFHDTVPALRRAQEGGLRLGIISNTDHVIIAHSINQMRIEFDEVIVAEDAQTYKPDVKVFETALAVIDANPSEILHVAFGFKYDIGPAQKMGMKTAWVNRNAEAIGGAAKPDFIWRDLWGLAAFVGFPSEFE